MDTGACYVSSLSPPIFPVPDMDIRGKEPQLKLDNVGFELAQSYTALRHEGFGDFRENSKIYFKEIVEFLKRLLGAQFVEVYDCTASINPRLTGYPTVPYTSSKP
ncbi:hypothetical protein B0O99DRAFT_689457 [Bisporella sp. PMI_857]|nr:hypothetical protein B0O99DRAFT_689457 [Bisporella sp. PMI_857]